MKSKSENVELAPWHMQLISLIDQKDSINPLSGMGLCRKLVNFQLGCALTSKADSSKSKSMQKNYRQPKVWKFSFKVSSVSY